MQRGSPFHLQIDCVRDALGAETLLLDRSTDVEDSTLCLPDECGSGTVHLSCVAPGLGYGELHIRSASERFHLQVEHGEPGFKLTVLLSPEEARVSAEGGGRPITVSPEESYVLSPQAVGTAFVDPGRSVHHLWFYVEKECFERLATEGVPEPTRNLEALLRNPNRSAYLHRGVTTPEIRLLVERIRTCTLTGSLRALYLDGIYEELFALRLQQICRGVYGRTSICPGTLRQLERRRIAEAQEILDAEYRSPPTIPQLARRVGLNTTCLKAGFRVEVGTTVFAYVRARRMLEAKQLLLDTEMSVGEVAAAVGYSNPGAFSYAFKQELGFCPSLLKK